MFTLMQHQNRRQQAGEETGHASMRDPAPSLRVPLSRYLPIYLIVIFLISACNATPAAPIPTRPPAPTFTPTVAEQPVAVDPAAAATAQAVAAEQAAIQATAQAAQAPANAAPVEATQPVTTTQPATEPQPPAESQPTATAEPPTATPAPTNPEVVVISGINVRQGPGTQYAVIGAANAGERFPVTGKNQAGDWWQVNFNGQAGWMFSQLVTPQNTQAVAVAVNIPAPPPPTNTPIPPPPAAPTNTPAPVAQAPTQAPAAPPPAAQGNFPFQLLATDRCEPNAGQTYMNGFVRYKSNALRNGVCVHMAFYGPRTTKCSGCDGVGEGLWGFSPFSGPAPAGTTVEIFVVQCSGALPLGGQNDNFTNLTPQSPKWVHTFNQSEQCTGITFVGD